MMPMPFESPEDMLKAMLPLKGSLEYRVFLSKLGGEQGQWLFVAIKLPEEVEEDEDNQSIAS